MLSRTSAITAAGIVLSQPTRITAASKAYPTPLSSIESAISSRLISEAFIPSVPMAMPSLMEMVFTSIGVPPATRTPAITCCASSRWLRLQGIVPIQLWATMTSGRWRSSLESPTDLR